jgi:hypothetical protein
MEAASGRKFWELGYKECGEWPPAEAAVFVMSPGACTIKILTAVI